MSDFTATAALLQLASPALPIGAFSYSSGLEMAIERGWVSDADSGERWISAQLNETVLQWEVPLWGRLFAAWGDSQRYANIGSLNAQAIAARETAELRSEQTQMGHALARWCKDVLAIPAAQISILTALESVSVLTAHALAAHNMNISVEQGAMAYAFGFVENQVMALSKALPLGQTAAQKMLRNITAELAPQVSHSLTLDKAQWSSAAPLAAIASMQHETQYTRLFRS